MSLVDWRRLVDVDARDGAGGFLALEVTDDGRLRVQLQTVRTSSNPRTVALEPLPALELDYSDAGLTLDYLREAMGVMLALQGNSIAAAAVVGIDAAKVGQAVALVHAARDTPRVDEPLSEGSDSIRDRG